MEANNQFGFNSCPSVSANSGLKLSSGEPGYSNGSSVSFPQQGRDINGDVKAVAVGTRTSPTAPSASVHSIVPNHHHGSPGCRQQWEQQSADLGASTHKQGHEGAAHFQAQGQYQLNGGHALQSPVVSPPNVTVRQYWNRGSTGNQQAGSYGGYRTYDEYRSPQQHYSMVPNGMPYSQHLPRTQMLLLTPHRSQQHSSVPVQMLASDTSPRRSETFPAAGQGQFQEAYKDMGSRYNGMELGSAVQHQPKPEAFAPKLPAPTSVTQDSFGPSVHRIPADIGLSPPRHSSTREALSEIASLSASPGSSAVLSTPGAKDSVQPLLSTIACATSRPSAVISTSPVMTSRAPDFTAISAGSSGPVSCPPTTSTLTPNLVPGSSKRRHVPHETPPQEDNLRMEPPESSGEIQCDGFSSASPDAKFEASVSLGSPALVGSPFSASASTPPGRPSEVVPERGAFVKVRLPEMSTWETAGSAGMEKLVIQPVAVGIASFREETLTEANVSGVDSLASKLSCIEESLVLGSSTKVVHGHELHLDARDGGTLQNTLSIPSSSSSVFPNTITIKDARESQTGFLPGEGVVRKKLKILVRKSVDSPKVSKPRTLKSAASPAAPSRPKKQIPKSEAVIDNGEDEGESPVSGRVVHRRRMATEEDASIPLQHGWKREVRVRKCEGRLKAETWYYSPCGKRMKQFPEVIKYLNRNQGGTVSREHFSFSPRMPVGDFYEERETPEGAQWFLLADVEVPATIMAITGRRGRPPNPDKVKPRVCRRRQSDPVRRRGRAKTKMEDLLSDADARLLKRLQAQETLTEEEKQKLDKIKKKMKRKARNKRKEDAVKRKIRQEKKNAKLQKAKEVEEQDKTQSCTSLPPTEPKKPGRRRRVVEESPIQEPIQPVQARRSTCAARGKAKALAKAKAEAEAAAQAAAAAKRQAERRAQAQRRMEERKRQQQILEELKRPTEDMCLTDHQPLPGLCRIPGLVLSGTAFSYCLVVVEFLHSYGDILGLQVSHSMPSLSTLQAGLLGLSNSQAQLQELLVELVQAALRDPGLPSHCQSVKILGDKLVDIQLTSASVSEGLRVFLEAQGFDSAICAILRTKPFQALPPESKARVLGFLVEELNSSNVVIGEIDKMLENMTVYRKNKWIIERKLHRLRGLLAERTGRSELDLSLVERRRSARVAEDESTMYEEGTVLKRGSRRRRKPKRIDADTSGSGQEDTASIASIAELERQIDKLAKRQTFFRKKLQQCSHLLRAVSLGQDRYRRRYWIMPHIGCVLVEGPEEILVSGDVQLTDEMEDVVPTNDEKPQVKKEPSEQLPLSPTQLHGEDEAMAGLTTSLMSTPRPRGRPRKIKPEVELHLRAARGRWRRTHRNSSSRELDPNWDLTLSLSPPEALQAQAVEAGEAAQKGHQEDTEVGTSSEVQVGEQSDPSAELPVEPPSQNTSDSAAQPQPEEAQSSNKEPDNTPDLLNDSANAILQASQLSLASSPPVCSTPLQRPVRRRRRGSGPGYTRGFSAATLKRRGRPPCTLLQQIEQKYMTQLVARPIPKGMVHGWWWIRKPEEVMAVLHALHPRGLREKVLHKHISKYREYLDEVCIQSVSDPMFQQEAQADASLSQTVQQPWDDAVKAMESDLSVLQWVEDLEQRVFAADLQLKVLQAERSDTAREEMTDPAPQVPQPDGQCRGSWGIPFPEPDSTRSDLEYFEHKVEELEDWTAKTKKEWSGFLRVPTNPLDVAVLRLEALERSIERRYLKEPLWSQGEVLKLAPLSPEHGEENAVTPESVENEITPRLRAWRQAVDRCRSAAQLSLCLLQLERAIAWERSIVKVTCLVCRKGDDDENLLLCDGCDRGCHMYCLRPKLTQVPEGDWFCPKCCKANGEAQRLRRTPKRNPPRRRLWGYSSGSSDDESSPRKSGGVATRQRESPAVSSHARFSGDSGRTAQSPAKRRRMTTRNQLDLTYCEIILMEMESHADAWPFLEPVNPRLVPGYRRIIKNPMDFLTMRQRLLNGGYCSCEEFAADAQLVFDNCQLFNEDTSEVGMAGHSMRRFFESRWAEFYENKNVDK